MKTRPPSVHARSRHHQVGSVACVVLLGALLASCGKARRIEGRVVSESGEPLAGVVVQVANSAFTATTDREGEYSLDYAPGTLQVVYAQEGRFPDTLSLTLSQKSHFPTAEVRLLRIPTEAGVVWISPGGYVALARAEVRENLVRPGRTIFDREVRDFEPTGEPTMVRDRAPRFLDTAPEGLSLIKLSDRGKIATVSYATFGLNASMETDRRQETKRRRSEACLERAAELEPGDYVYAAFSSGMVSKPSPGCYYFRIAPNDTMRAAKSPGAGTGGAPATDTRPVPSYAGQWSWDGGEEGTATWVLHQNGKVVEGRYEWSDGSEQARWAEVRGEVKPDGSITLAETKAGVGDATEAANCRYAGRIDPSGAIVGTQSFTDSQWKNDWRLTRAVGGAQ